MLLQQEQVEKTNHEKSGQEPTSSQLSSAIESPSDLAKQMAPRTPSHHPSGEVIKTALLQGGHHRVNIVLPGKNGGGAIFHEIPTEAKKNATKPEKETQLAAGHLYHRDQFSVEHRGQRG